jgi:hypothetical protein
MTAPLMGRSAFETLAQRHRRGLRVPITACSPPSTTRGLPCG